MNELDINWGRDIYSKQKRDETKIITMRLPLRYIKMLKENNVNYAKLMMRACEKLDNSLIKDGTK